MKDSVKKALYRLIDICFLPFSFLILPVLKRMRRHGVSLFPLTLKRFLSVGVFPIRDHYYEPQIKYSKGFEANKPRRLFIDFNLEKQVASLSSLRYSNELSLLPLEGNTGEGKFYVNNPAFGPGDCDLYYLLVRNIKPRRIIEIGSGYSTLVCLEALKKNALENAYTDLCCIEPYEMGWLEQTPGIRLIRENVEKVSPAIFSELEENDILFIDSSHIIRPENDVLFEFLEVLPRLRKGVIVHIHDIFSPRHYPADWLQKEFRFWNEQYLLEAFLYYNDSFEVLYSLNHLKNDAFQETRKTLTTLSSKDEPASFWLRKVR